MSIKKKTKIIVAFILSVFIMTAGCKKDMASRISEYTGSYELATPTGTRVLSDEPDLPEEIVYWDPHRELKPEYTLKEATEKYAFIVNHTSLIYTACDDLAMTHTFRCVDYGHHLFTNFNTVICLDPNGEVHDGLTSYLDLDTVACTSSDQLISVLPHKFVGPMGYYSEESSDLDINVIESADNYALVHIQDYREESLYYGRPLGKTWLLIRCNRYFHQDKKFTEKDISDFKQYADILFDHLSPDNGTEPYIYDKIVNTPLLSGMHLTGFNSLDKISSSSISLLTRKGTHLYDITLTPDASDKALSYGDWEDMGDMKSCKSDWGSQKLYFTMDGVSYLCHFQNSTGEHTDFDSSEDLIKFIRKSCYVT
ncbi:MAG: hypothetical protein IKD90_06895 [Clostridiales bacterium]|nr:hypothetical protein [Clostridiales bacterium]